MAISELVLFPDGVGAEQYDPVQAEMGLENDPPEGLIAHVAGEVNGHFQILNIWESADNQKSFENDRLRPAMKKAMGEERYAAMPDAERPQVKLHNHFVP